MLVYKTFNVYGANVTDRFIDMDKINAVAAEGWKLINITVPPSGHNNRYVCGVFVRDESASVKTVSDDAPLAAPKRLPGRPPKEPKIQEPEEK